MRRERLLVALCGLLTAVASAARGGDMSTSAPASMPTSAPALAALDLELHKSVTPLLKQFCYECHGEGASAGDLELDSFKTTQDIRAAKPTFQKVIRYIR